MNPISIRNAAITTARDILDDPDRYVVLDTETSGVGALAEILELAILSPTRETLFHQYFQPKQAISPPCSGGSRALCRLARTERGDRLGGRPR